MRHSLMRSHEQTPLPAEFIKAMYPIIRLLNRDKLAYFSDVISLKVLKFVIVIPVIAFNPIKLNDNICHMPLYKIW